ncbi:branched-chain-amino-acid aminotransferase-like protein 2 [Anneissia japonica]|uniref:branched-chain-amino-acid aminotransferase-like protein 2 n=1 Tax=Anneissia japonica TaxID=1529436 RepID=UPI0014256206|nr:branched-chain-amino-acid aminotransferase-like protein 2 [Anneissia japonica]
MSNPKQVRVILWTTPRSLSTAFLKSVSTFQNAEIFQEPFVSAGLFGPDRNKQSTTDEMNTFLENAEGMEEYTYDGVKAMLEMEYHDKHLIFSKDGGQFMHGHFDKIPLGYKHVFLTRRPSKVLMSIDRMLTASNTLAKHGSCRSTLPGTPHRQLFELMEYVRDIRHQDPLIIDGDDLQMKPQLVMRAFCDFVGLSYSDKMMTWESGPDSRWRISNVKKLTNEIIGLAHKKAFNSTGFDARIPEQEPSLEEMDEKTRTRVVEAQPYYEKLMEMKLKI